MPRSAAPSAAQVQTVQSDVAEAYRRVREFSNRLVEPLQPEDCVIQSMPDVSPTRWHLAHTTWFFETFVLAGRTGHRAFDPAFEYLFNSYYNSVGEQFPRARRGLISRPTLREVLDYRRYVDERVLRMLETADPEQDAEALRVVELGLHHEQQHQELILTDILHVLSCNPLYPAYQAGAKSPSSQQAVPLAWVRYDEGIRHMGHTGEGFAFDNESPRHRVFLEAFELASRPVTCGEFCEFIADGGYARPELWLSLGWAAVQSHNWQAPLYWVQQHGEWKQFTLAGLIPLDPAAPVCHVSFFEADAYARWAGARLPTEFEWETAAEDVETAGNFAESLVLRPLPTQPRDKGTWESAGHPRPAALFGDVWEWTGSPYVSYPGYRPASGALGEYNGKFMCNQYVLRGGSCATSESHFRPTYRNFFPPDARWQFAGIRLAR